MTAPDLFALGGRQDDADPLVALWVEHARVRAQRDATPCEKDDDADYLGDQLSRIEDQMDALVPISIAGALVQLRLLQFYDCIGGPPDKLLENLIAGVERLSETCAR